MMPKVSFPEFVMIWDQQQGLSMPRHHVKICQWLDQAWHNGRRELLLMAFRSSGKSTLVGLFCAWLFLCHPDLRIMVMAADFALAKKMVRNVKRLIERHPLTQALKPDRKDQWASDQFTIKRPSELRDPSMLAKGIGANITGSRADVVICDDVEVPNTCDTAAKRVDLRERLQEIDYVLVPGGLQLYVGTPHTYYTIYGRLACAEMGEEVPFLSGFERFELPILDGAGQSAWPDRFPPSKIERMKARTGQNKFDSQMMLRAVNIANSRLDPDLMVRYEANLQYEERNGRGFITLQDRSLHSVSCWWDPSFGAADKGDKSVIAAVFSDAEGGYWLQGLRYLTVNAQQGEDTDEATQLCQQVVSFVKQYHIPSVTVESNGIGKFLPSLLRRELSLAGVRCAVIAHHNHKNKAERILSAFDVVLAARSLHIHEEVWKTAFPMEMREWQPARSQHDDALDAVAGCLLNEPVRLGSVTPMAHAGTAPWMGSGGTHVAQSDFAL